MTVEAHQAVEAIWRTESPRLIATLARLVGDVGLAEELAQDACVAALQQWPADGVPDKPGAWLMTIGKRRAFDHLRRRTTLEAKQQLLRREVEESYEDELPDEVQINDDLLRLMFIACHPVLSTEARVALTLRLLGGLTTAEIARGFLTSEATVAQRVVRAKRTLGEAKVPFELPSGGELQERISSVLEVIYLVFNEGYSATAGDDWHRPALCAEAIRLGRLLADLAPDEPEVLGLVALMEVQASRSAARVSQSGEPVLLLEQDRSRWDRALIDSGFDALTRAMAMGGTLGPYALQASIAICHAFAPTAEETDWHQISALYDALSQVAPSPVVEVNRAVALSMAFGPEAGLELIDALLDVPALRSYHLLPAVRGDLLARLGRHDEARAELQRAAALTSNESERKMLQRRAEDL